MSNQSEPGLGVRFISGRPSVHAPELQARPYELVMETEVESLEKMQAGAASQVRNPRR